MGINYVFSSDKKTKILYKDSGKYLEFGFNEKYPDKFIYITEDDKEAKFLNSQMLDKTFRTKTNPKRTVVQKNVIKAFKWENEESYEMQKKLMESEARLEAKAKEADAFKEMANEKLKAEGSSDEEVQEKLVNAVKDKEVNDLKELLKTDKYQEVAEANDIKIKLNFGLDKLKKVASEIESHFGD